VNVKISLSQHVSDFLKLLPANHLRDIRMEDIEKQPTQSKRIPFVKELSPIKMKLEVDWPQMRWRDELVHLMIESPLRDTAIRRARLTGYSISESAEYRLR
jgi:hypothetical protein